MSKLDPIDDGNCYGRLLDNIYGPKQNRGKLSKQPRHATQACESAHGPRPPGYVVRHLCPNDTYLKWRGEGSFVCINPAHIEWNTRKQNTADARHNMSAAKKGKKRGPYKKRITALVSVEQHFNDFKNTKKEKML